MANYTVLQHQQQGKSSLNENGHLNDFSRCNWTRTAIGDPGIRLKSTFNAGNDLQGYPMHRLAYSALQMNFMLIFTGTSHVS